MQIHRIDVSGKIQILWSVQVSRGAAGRGVGKVEPGLEKILYVGLDLTLWAVVIVLLMLVQPKIKTKSNNQDISEFLKDILLDYTKDEDWQQPSFLTDSILDVIQTASEFRLEPRSQGR